MYLLKKKTACRWVHAVQICVVQRSSVHIVLFIVCAFCVISRKSLSQRQRFSMFSSKSFIILTLTFMSMMGYELNLYMVWSQHSFFSPIRISSYYSTIHWKSCSFPYWIALASLSKINWPYIYGPISRLFHYSIYPPHANHTAFFF